ncbi:tetratricopeptide repeat protein [Bacteroides pyogenes]|uniref:Tetratricopeptide repeat protein n=1 Tax=Bacteroides pyogenes TaxID=310300 RepID=A0A5D3EDT5_9BACE|nr:tetratricopeptide repeat protein [Bacteroides pyogenes]TYK34059.1 tetratricopeptide repeat protein [Bacteroides pyogenes]TYK47627.1 tetratricopeptide repeat protein [Bacteroides pyogenes]
MKQLIYSIWISVLGICTVSFSYAGYARGIDKKEFERIVRKSDSISDTLGLRTYFDRQIDACPGEHKQMLRCAYYVRLAQLWAQQEDGVNEKSDSLFKKALRVFPLNGNKGFRAWLNTQYGFYYYSFGQYTRALPHFVTVARMIEDFPFNKCELYMVGETYRLNAYYRGTLGDDETSLSYLLTSLIYTPETDKKHCELLNNIGTIYHRQGKLDEALKFHEKAIRNALAHKDSTHYAKALGEIAQIHVAHGEYDIALRMLTRDIAISRKIGDEGNTMYASMQMAKVYLWKNDFESAKSYLTEVYAYLNSKKYLADCALRFAELIEEIDTKERTLENALEILRKVNGLQPFLSATDGELMLKYINLEIQKDEFAYQLRMEKSNRRIEVHRNIVLSLFAFCLLVCLVLVFFRVAGMLKNQKFHYKKRILSLQSDKDSSEKELEKTYNSLVAYQNYLDEKNKQIVRLEAEIKYMVSTSPGGGPEMEKLLTSHLMTKENWQSFKEMFIKENYKAYSAVLNEFPEISEAALRIELVQKLGFTNAETARILGITVDAVKKSKQRLRKKHPC